MNSVVESSQSLPEYVAARPFVAQVFGHNSVARATLAKLSVTQSMPLYGAIMGGIGVLLWPTYGVYAAIAIYFLSFQLALAGGTVLAASMLAVPKLSNAQWAQFQRDCKPESFSENAARFGATQQEQNQLALRMYAARSLETPLLYNVSWIAGGVLCALVGAAIRASAV